MKPKNSLFSRGGQAAAFFTAVTLCVAGQSFAAEYDWNAATGDFNNAANWNISGFPAVAAPGNGDIANVANGGNAQWTTNAAYTVQELRAGNGAAGTISISGGNAFTSANGVLVGRQSGTPIGTLNVSGAGTIFNVTTGNTHVGTVSHTFGTAGAGAAGVLNISSGAVFNHNPGGDDSFIIGNNLPNGANPVQAGTYKGTLNVDGGTLNVLNGSRLHVGQSQGGVGEMNVSNGGLVNVTDDDMVIGRAGTGILNLSGGTITKSGGGTFIAGFQGGTSTVNHTGGALNVAGGEFWIGQDAGSTGTYTLGAGATLTTNFWTTIGRAGGTGTFNLDGGTITKNGGGQVMVGAWDGGPSVGLFNHNSGDLNIVGGELWVGNGRNDTARATGTYNLKAGSVSVNNWVAVGRAGGTGTMNVSGGTLTKTGIADNHFVIGQGNHSNSGTLNVSADGTVNITAGQLWVSEDSPGEANISGNGRINAPAVQIARYASPSGGGELNLNGGTLQTGRIFGGEGISAIEFNGGKLVATADQPLFIANVDTATITGGLTLDTSTYNVGVGTLEVPQIIGGTGNLTKQGTGTLTLNSVNTYGGTTTVSGGKLIVATNTGADNTVIVAADAGFGVILRDYSQSFQPAGLSLAGSTLDVNYGGIGDTAEPPIDVDGTLTLNGTNNFVNIGAALPGAWSVGSTVPVLRYDTLAGTGGVASVKLGTLPLGMQATLVHDQPSKTFNLNVTRLAIPVWVGGVSSIWNTSDANWANLAGNFGNNYANGDPVMFDDYADTNRFNVQLPGTVSPGAYVTFNNTAQNYTLSGAGKISGTTRLVKQGTGSVTLNTTANDFTGGVRIEGGSVIIPSLSNGGAASPIGAASAAPENLLLAGGILSYSGATAATNRGFTIAAAGGGIGVQTAATNLTVSGTPAATAGGLVKTGAGTLTLTGSGAIGNSAAVRVESGKLVLTSPAAANTQVITAGELWVGNTQAAPATMDIINTTLTTNNWLAVGRGNGAPEGSGPHTSTLNISGGSVVSVVNISTGFANGLGVNTATQNINIANSKLNNSGQTALGEGRGATTNITATGNSELNTREVRAAMGGGVPLGASAVNITLQDEAVWNVGTEASISFASIGFGGGTGNLTVKGNAKFLNYDDFSLGEGGTSTGTLTIQDSAIVAVRTPLLGRGADATALITQTGGSFSNRGDANLQIGVAGDAVYNLSGGTVTANGHTAVSRFATSTSSLNISGGSYTQVAADRLMIVAEEGNGTLSVSGGTLQVNGGLRGGLAASGVATINQTGGTINVATNALLGAAGKATVTLSGGQFNVKTGGTGGWNMVVGDGGASEGILNISDAANLRLWHNSSLRIGSTTSTGNNVVNQTGGTVTTFSDAGTTVGGTGIVLIGGNTASGNNTYNLSGGTLVTGGVRSDSTATSGNRKLVFNGGTLRASGNSTNFIAGLTAVEVVGGANIDTNSFNVTAVNALSQAGNGGLTKSGAGVLTLAGVNTYVGNTAINAGGIALADNAQLRFVLGANGVNNSITGTGAATLDGDFLIQNVPASIANGNSWTLVAGSVNETYGATFNVIGYTKSGNVWTRIDGGNTWTFSQATGVLTLTTGGVTDPYTTWTNTYFPGVTDQNIIGRNADPDGDGSSNALEFALGGVPNNGADNAKVYSLQADGSVDSDTDKELLLTIAVRAATPAFSVGTSPSASKDGVTYTIQGSLDLTGFATGVTEVNVVAPASAPNPPAGYEYRTFSLNGSNNLTGKGFLRVRVN